MSLRRPNCGRSPRRPAAARNALRANSLQLGNGAGLRVRSVNVMSAQSQAMSRQLLSKRAELVAAARQLQAAAEAR